ncbi:dihydroorotase [Achromobacter aegrifaciens]|uniref:dihydroorotase n=1 Tax=Achromobacter aegrifaciens TaxID=1287736 RepID=UPI000F73FBBF|nr:dihydroorotase [Achromobacter aegrifaciens]RSE91120.1 dihydroorotase [Achromobacter aegrifaciens]
MSTQNTTQLTITRPDDWHLHLRDGAALEAVVADTARQFARAIIMPNLKPPVTTTEQALAYRGRILEALKKAGGNPDAFTPLMTLYLTDNTTSEEIFRSYESGQVYAVKLYPAGATTNSDAGVTDLLGKCTKALEALEKCGMPLLVHGEVTDPSIDLFDREAIFVERVMKPLRRAFPALKVVFEHITTKEGAEYVRDADGPIAATITPQHLLYNRNAIFQGGVRPHFYCLPVLKRETHRLALVEAATSGSPRFFLGTDSAPHARGLKEHACGCAGCYTALHAMELYATAFDAVGKLDKLEGFASFHGPDFYGLPRNTGTLTLVREAYQVPEEVAFGNTTLVPLAAGEALTWRARG